MAERLWQCLQTRDERETVEKWGRTEANREEKKIDEAERDETENWRGMNPRACVGPNASDLIDLEADEAAAWKYDVMRICTGSLLLGLHLPEPREENGLSRRDCRPNGLGFSANMRTRSFTVK